MGGVRPPWWFIAHRGSGSADKATQAVEAWVAPEDRLVWTDAPDDVLDVVREAHAAGAWVGVVGGDGSIRCVIEALRACELAVPLGIVPGGTGNDLCRTLGIPLDPTAALALLDIPRWLPLDGIDVHDADGTWLGRGINASVVGDPAGENDQLDPTWKALLGPIALRLRQPAVLATVEPSPVTLVWDGEAAAAFEVFGVVVASGTTAGGGVLLAPGADPTDGCLDVMVLHGGDRAAVLGAMASVLAGEADRHPLIERHVVRSVAIEGGAPFPVNLDGDVLDGSPATWSVVPKAVWVAVGDDVPVFAAEAQDAPGRG